MLPDATEGFATVVKSDFPFAAFIASLGFLLILFLEKVLVGRSEDALVETKEEAQRRADFEEQKRNVPLKVYECPDTNGYHLTKDD